MQVIDEVRKYFKEKTFNTIIPRNIKLAEAPSYSQPIYYYDPTCIGAKAYMNLAEEILQEKIDVFFIWKLGSPDIVNFSN